MSLTSEKEQIREAVYRALTRVRGLTLDENALATQETTVLLGEGAALDSMGFVNFLLFLDEELSEASGREVNLVDKLTSSEEKVKRISTVGDLIEYISGLRSF